MRYVDTAATTNQSALMLSPRLSAMPPNAAAPAMAMPTQSAPRASREVVIDACPLELRTPARLVEGARQETANRRQRVRGRHEFLLLHEPRHVADRALAVDHGEEKRVDTGRQRLGPELRQDRHRQVRLPDPARQLAAGWWRGHVPFLPGAEGDDGLDARVPAGRRREIGLARLVRLGPREAGRRQRFDELLEAPGVAGLGIREGERTVIDPVAAGRQQGVDPPRNPDRKSTRLNSSHGY